MPRTKQGKYVTEASKTFQEGDDFWKQGNYDEARSKYAKAAELYDKKDDPQGEAFVLTRLGELDLSLDNFDKAEKSLKAAAELVADLVDGSITHGQQYINLYNGKIFHDGSRRRGPDGGNANFRPVLHDGWARRGEARHSIWGWKDVAVDKGPIFTYGALADSCAMTAQSTMEDSLELSDSMEIEIVRYTLHDGEAKHDGKTRYGGEEVRQ